MKKIDISEFEEAFDRATESFVLGPFGIDYLPSKERMAFRDQRARDAQELLTLCRAEIDKGNHEN